MDSCVDDIEVLVDVAGDGGIPWDRGEAWLDEEEMEESGGVAVIGATGIAGDDVNLGVGGTTVEGGGTETGLGGATM